MTDIEELSLYQPEPMESLLCEMCDTEPITVDREWLGPGKWQLTKICPDCGREGQLTMESGGFVSKNRSGWADRIARIYVETKMSESSLERSLDRLYNLDSETDSAPHRTDVESDTE